MTQASNLRATLADVAARAGVSIATASKVVNGRPDVASDTRARVEAAIGSLGYQPQKRREANGGKGSVALLTDMINTAYAMEIVRGAMLACEELGVDLTVERLHQSDDLRTGLTSAGLTHRLLSHKRLGAVALTAGLPESVYRDVMQARLPIVMIDPLDSTFSGAYSVGATNWLGGRSAAEHLIELGHERLGVLSGPHHSLSARARLDGFLSGCAEAGIFLPDHLIQSASFGTAEARRTAKAWFSSLEELPTGIIVSSDTQAMGILQAAKELGIDVPADLSVVSYDDTHLAAAATPRLTAVHQPLEEMGRRAIETILRISNGIDSGSHHIELATRLVIRDSTAPSRS